jgi:GntR family transcriptional regulator
MMEKGNCSACQLLAAYLTGLTGFTGWDVLKDPVNLVNPVAKLTRVNNYGEGKMRLQRDAPIPLYYQLAEQIREQIESGQLEVGERIPSVKELTEQHGISPMTVRQALGELQRKGLLEIRRGIGTFVASPKITYNLLHLTSFTEDMVSQGLVTHTKLIHLALETPTEYIAQQLQIPLGEMVVHVERLRYSSDDPILIDYSYLPSSLCPGLEEKDLETNSLYAQLEECYQFALDHATHVLEATGANDYEARLLGVPIGSPIVLVRGVTYLADDRPIEYFKSIYRGDRYKFRWETARPHRRAL